MTVFCFFARFCFALYLHNIGYWLFDELNKCTLQPTIQTKNKRPAELQAKFCGKTNVSRKGLNKFILCSCHKALVYTATNQINR